MVFIKMINSETLVGSEFEARKSYPFIRGASQEEYVEGTYLMYGEKVRVSSYNEKTGLYKLENLNTPPHWFEVTEDELNLIRGIKNSFLKIQERVHQYITDIGEWLNAEGSVNILAVDNDENTVFLQLHATDDLKPLYRIYEIDRSGNIGNDELTENLEEAVNKFEEIL
jgi:hypothetical protein